MEGIVWQRWLVYFLFGVPFLAWLFFTRNQVLRVLAVLSVLIFIQNSFADRRYLWAIGVGPFGQDQLAVAARHGISFVPHNICIAMSLKTGILGLASFLAIVGVIALRNLRAWGSANDWLQKLHVLSLFVAVNAFLIVGFAERVYDNGHKLNNLFWFFAGLSFATSQRVLAQARERSVASDPALPLEEAPAHGL